MIEITEKKNCSGCHACSNICPKRCIEMKADEEGFLYPFVNHDQCIKCGLCKNSCPIINAQPDDKKEPRAYACFNKDLEIRLKSSSGGIFSLLAESLLENGGVVFGAGFNKNFEVVHQCVKQKEDLDILRTSKYVQSRIGETYKSAQEFLKQGKQVLFTGTPCQIEGLRKFLKKDFDNLLTHGVPSPSVWEKYVNYRKEKDNGEIKNISFRNKNSGWHKFSMCFEYASGEFYSKKLNKDPMMKLFLKNTCLRPSCYDCKFKKISRVSDITLADFWGIGLVARDLDDNKGTSLVLINSKKGQEVFEKIKHKINFREVDFKKSIRLNPSIKKSCKHNPKRINLMQDLNSLPFDKILKKYAK